VFPIRDNAPTRRFPAVTVGIIAANVVVFLWEYSGRGLDRHVYEYGYYPCKVEAPCTVPYTAFHHPASWWETVFTSMFMHGGIVHIAGNMLFLWIFGNNVEDVMGRARFLLWYLACGIAATAAQTFVTLHFANAHDASIPNVGASGAIAGVLGAYFVILPRASVLTLITLGFFFIFREVPAILFLGIWIVFQLIEGGFSITHPEAGGGVAFFAHVGGFVFGLATVYLVAKRRPLSPQPRYRW
jgi:membrane associated rhomboid family serine protease